MFSRIDIEEELNKLRNKRTNELELIQNVYELLAENEEERTEIKDRLQGQSSEVPNKFDLDLLETDRIFHISEIKQICVTYRLRFLDSHYFKGEFPEEAVSKIRHLEKEHRTTLSNFKIVAPGKLLKLENADDPLLFAQIGNNYFYLIHKWGHDLHPFRKLLMWPFKNLDNITISVVALSALITLLSPMHWFTQNPGIGNYIFLFMIVLNGVGGMVLFFGVAKGKSFNVDIWDSKYYNN